MWVQSLGQEVPLEKDMATHSSILVWEIPWTEESGGYSPLGRKESDTTEATWHAQVLSFRQWDDLTAVSPFEGTC